MDEPDGKGERSPDELEIELEYLIDQYQSHMKIHRMKSRTRILESIVVAGSNFISLKWGENAQALFSFRRSRLELMEEELKSPGKEVAYIVNVREKFQAATQ